MATFESIAASNRCQSPTPEKHTVPGFLAARAWSHEREMDPRLWAAYQTYLRALAAMPTLDDTDTQKTAHIDRWLFTREGDGMIAVEEKFRSKDYGDIYLEVSQVRADGRPCPGWIEEPGLADWLAYVTPRRIVLIPWVDLQVVYREHAAAWRTAFGTHKSVDRDGRVAIGVAVPISVLKSLIPDLIEIVAPEAAADPGRDAWLEEQALIEQAHRNCGWLPRTAA